MVACGKVSDPLPPLVQVPAAVSDMVATQRGSYVKLSWTLPKLNTNGSTATTLGYLELLRLAQPAGSALPSGNFLIESGTKLASLHSSNFDAYRVGEKLVFTDTLRGDDEKEIFRSQFVYGVRVFNQKGQGSGLSNLASVQLQALPEPPSDLKAQLAEDFIEIEWQPPSQRIDHSPFDGTAAFNLYRKGLESGKQEDLLNTTPISESRFKDRTMILDKSYEYTVRSVMSSSGVALESFDSSAIQVTNRDLYPPKAPTELTAISGQKYISLVWLPNNEGDLAGYHVYRRGEIGDNLKLTEKPLTTAAFIDRAVEKGKLYRYRIKAIDTHGNESLFSDEVEEKVE
jgi:hypothetical protein